MEAEKRSLGGPPIVKPSLAGKAGAKGAKSPELKGVFGRIQSVLERKGQVILYGPPGTGKTYWAERTALDLASYSLAGKPFEELSDGEKAEVVGGPESLGTVRMCCFHPAYGYEDFIEGYRPELHEGRMTFALRDGIFKQLCRDAESTARAAVLPDHRRDQPGRHPPHLRRTADGHREGQAGQVGHPAAEPVGIPGAPERLPHRHHEHGGPVHRPARHRPAAAVRLRRVDAGRRPCWRGANVADIPLGPWLDALNRRICEHVGRDARNLQVGHSFLLEAGKPVKDAARFFRVVRDEIIPLLEEYCYEDYDALHAILGSGLVDLPNRAIRHDLFEEPTRPELVQALLAPCPDILTSLKAVTTLESDEGETEPEDDDDDDRRATS